MEGGRRARGTEAGWGEGLRTSGEVRYQRPTQRAGMDKSGLHIGQLMSNMLTSTL